MLAEARIKVKYVARALLRNFKNEKFHWNGDGTTLCLRARKKKNVETDDLGNRQITITNFSFVFFHFIAVDIFDKHIF